MARLLIVVDYQNDFINPQGLLYVKGSEKLQNRIVRLIRDQKKNKEDVVFLKDTHDLNYMKTEEGKHLPYPHTIKGTEGHELYEKVKDLSRYFPIFEKDTFGSVELGHFLETRSYDEIVICGVMTNYCVIANAIIAKTFNPNAHCIIYKKAVTSGNKKTDRNVLKLLSDMHFEVI